MWLSDRIKDRINKVIIFSVVLVLSLIILECHTFDNNRLDGRYVKGIKQPIISLNGTWKFCLNPPEKFWQNETSPAVWHDIQVPGECAMQGFAIKNDTPYVYKKEIFIPDDYQEKSIVIKFHGVYGYARVWINGTFIRDHHGGFTAWECDITEHIAAGETNNLLVEITDRKDDLSYGSGYAKHQIGGILRDVQLMALPKNHLKSFYIETNLDQAYRDATLKIQMETVQLSRVSVNLRLYSPDNDKVPVLIEKLAIPLMKKTASFNIPVKNPIKWDAEHPNLYTLRTEFFNNNKLEYSFSQKIGFRKLEVEGNKFLVNGKVIKLRGACRHDMHPLLGRMTTPEYDKKDVLLAKEANINYIRTSHYPPSESFLKYCDQYGIYVEDETAVCFVNMHRAKEYATVTQSGPQFKERYLSQIKEMIHYHRNHPCIIIWSIGNENKYDENFALCYDYIKSVDKTRPVMFSYPGEVPQSEKCYDILSMHYPSYKGCIRNQHGISIENFEYDVMPVLFDEWAHVACYNKPTLQIDPNARNFWGQSIDSMWTNLFASEGGLGGAIWGMIDETFMLPETLRGFNQWWGIMDEHTLPAAYEGPCVGYGEWGIVDIWRRKKPEFWHTKKAYSPTKILVKEIKTYQPGTDLKIPVFNRFNHTNFSELKIVWSYKDMSRILAKHSIAPFKKGELTIPAADWQAGDFVTLEFYQNDTCLLDRYKLRLGSCEIHLPLAKPGNLSAEEDQKQLAITGKSFAAIFSKSTGLLECMAVNNNTLISSGPYLNFKVPGDYVYYSTIVMDDLAQNWKLTSLNFELNDSIANIYTEGCYNSIDVKYHMQVDELGLMIIHYQVSGLPAEKNLQECGLYFFVEEKFDQLSWHKNTYWTTYPELHLGMPQFTIELHQNPILRYRQDPKHPWELDDQEFYYLGLEKKLSLSKIARGLKENIYHYCLILPDKSMLQILSDGSHACRLESTEKGYILYINKYWDYTSLIWGNYMKRIRLPNMFNDTQYLKCTSYSEGGSKD